MSRILLTWEMGGGSGHTLNLLSLATELRDRGHECIFVLKDLSRIEESIGQKGFDFLQAPIWLPKAVGFPPTVSFADILLKLGYLEAKGLTGLVKAWRKIFELTSPDLLVIDHSPTALLASRDLSIPRVLYGTGFASPPMASPLPSMYFWQDIPNNKLITNERKVLTVINQVLDEVNGAPLEQLSDLFSVDANFIRSFQELDHYPQRIDGEYCGPAFNTNTGIDPVWPMGKDKKIFAYINPSYQSFSQVMQALTLIPCQALVYAPGITDSQIKQHHSGSVTISKQAYKIEKIQESCDLCICHSGIGTGSAMLLAGCPLLLLPTQLEQLIVSLNIEKTGSAFVVKKEVRNTNFKKIIKELISNNKYLDSAKQFSKKYASFSQKETNMMIAKKIEKILDDIKK